MDIRKYILTTAACILAFGLLPGAYAQGSKIVAGDRDTLDFFGRAVSISGNYAIVGASYDNYNQSLSGAAYIFEKNGNGTWSQVQKLMVSDTSGGYNFFGRSVAIDGDYALVGADIEDKDASGFNPVYHSGAVYIFERGINGWAQAQKIVASDRQPDDIFGHSVAVFGNYAIVGASFQDYDENGAGTALGQAGAAYIYERANGNWNEVQKIVASDRTSSSAFGDAVSINNNRVVVGAPGEFGFRGAAYIFEKAGNNTWNQVKKIIASDREADDFFGYSVSVSDNKVIVGAPYQDKDANEGNFIDGAGAAYIFETDGNNNWNEDKIVASDRASSDDFGNSVAIHGDRAIIGAQYQDKDAYGGDFIDYAGAAYIFEKDGNNNWNEEKIVAADRASNEYFGSSVAISEEYALVGVQGENEDANGGNTVPGAGAAYIIDFTCLENLTITKNIGIFSGPYSYTTGQDIIAVNDILVPGIPVSYKAGRSIRLLPGFSVLAPTDFLATIEPCTGNGNGQRMESGYTLNNEQNALGNMDMDEIVPSVYPNPFTQAATFEYSVMENNTSILLEVYNIQGQKVGTVVQEEKPRGNHIATFEAGNLPEGMYLYKVQVGDKTHEGKVLLMR